MKRNEGGSMAMTFFFAIFLIYAFVTAMALETDSRPQRPSIQLEAK